jgi:hypothetical protein
LKEFAAGATFAIAASDAALLSAVSTCVGADGLLAAPALGAETGVAGGWFVAISIGSSFAEVSRFLRLASVLAAETPLVSSDALDDAGPAALALCEFCAEASGKRVGPVTRP